MVYRLHHAYHWVKTNRMAAARAVMIALLCCVFVYSVYKVIDKLADYQQSENLYAELRDKYGPSTIGDTTVPGPSLQVDWPSAFEGKSVAAPPVLPAEHELIMNPRLERSRSIVGMMERQKELETNLFDKSPELLKLNKDLVGWIKIPDTNIDYPVVRTKDNDFYLEHDFKKRKNSAGSIFMDYRNDKKFSDANTIVYGHNMKNKSMFHDVVQFKDKTYFDNHGMIYVYTKDGVQKWQVFLVFVTDVSFDYLKTDFASQAEFQDYLKAVRKKAYHIANVKVTAKDKILTLSTCSYEYDQARTVVMAKLIS